MELVYSVTPSVKIRRDWGREETAICTLSPRNTIAFTSAVVVNGTRTEEARYPLIYCSLRLIRYTSSYLSDFIKLYVTRDLIE